LFIALRSTPKPLGAQSPYHAGPSGESLSTTPSRSSKSQEFDLSQGLHLNSADLHISPRVMEPSCSSLSHILDKVAPNVYMFGAIIEHRIPQQSNPPLVITEDHDGIQHVSKKLTEELPQLDSFPGCHTHSYVSGLSNAQSNRLLLLAHPRYRRRTQRESAPISALAILHTSYPSIIRIAASHSRQYIAIHE